MLRHEVSTSAGEPLRLPPDCPEPLVIVSIREMLCVPSAVPSALPMLRRSGPPLSCAEWMASAFSILRE
jgi:hypothetical protein